MNKFWGWAVELCKSYLQKHDSHRQSNTWKQNLTVNITKSHRESTTENEELDRLKEDIQQLEKEIRVLIT